MKELPGFSDQLELPNVPEGPGVIVLEDNLGRVLQVLGSNNVRRRIGELMDSKGTICTYGTRVYDAQQGGHRLTVRWKLTSNYTELARRLAEQLRAAWA